MTDFTLPELGENVKQGDVLRVLVKPGDTINKDQPVLELETDKATIEVPSSVAGKVKDVRVKAGDKVKVGQAILSVDDGGGKAAPAAAPGKKGQNAPEEEEQSTGADTAQKVAPEQPGLEQHVEGKKKDTPADKPGVTGKVVDISRGARPAEPEQAPSSEFPPAPAAPSVRRTARELGVDINQVAGT